MLGVGCSCTGCTDGCQGRCGLVAVGGSFAFGIGAGGGGVHAGDGVVCGFTVFSGGVHAGCAGSGLGFGGDHTGGGSGSMGFGGGKPNDALLS